MLKAYCIRTHKEGISDGYYMIHADSPSEARSLIWKFPDIKATCNSYMDLRTRKCAELDAMPLTAENVSKFLVFSSDPEDGFVTKDQYVNLCDCDICKGKIRSVHSFMVESDIVFAYDKEDAQILYQDAHGKHDSLKCKELKGSTPIMIEDPDPDFLDHVMGLYSNRFQCGDFDDGLTVISGVADDWIKILGRSCITKKADL